MNSFVNELSSSLDYYATKLLRDREPDIYGYQLGYREFIEFLRPILVHLNHLENFTRDEIVKPWEDSWDLRWLFDMEPMSYWLTIGGVSRWVPISYNIDVNELRDISREPWTQNMIVFLMYYHKLDSYDISEVYRNVVIWGREERRRVNDLFTRQDDFSGLRLLFGSDLPSTSPEPYPIWNSIDELLELNISLETMESFRYRQDYPWDEQDFP